MGGIFTQSRDLGGPPVPVVRYNFDGRVDQMLTVPDLHNQTTTSYRSGPRWDVPEDVLATPDARIFYEPKVALADSYDTGHEFDSYTKRRILYQRADSEVIRTSVDGKTRVRGPMVLNFPSGADALNQGFFLDIPKMTSNEINLWGGRAFQGTIPTTPKANLGQFLGELWRDGLPSLPLLNTLRDRASLSRSAGGEYLNAEFGWKPLVADVVKIAKSLATVNNSLFQAQRDSGRIVRRGLKFPPVTTGHDFTWSNAGTDTPVFGYSDIFEQGQLGYGNNATSGNETVTQRYWFKGAYTYYFEMGDSLASKLREFEQKSNLLLGTRLNPSTLWELAPWSWLVDWYGTIGTLLSNASQFSEDSLVLKYGYLMRHTIASRTISASVYRHFEAGQPALTVTNLYRTERKERVKATPYGFGLNTEDFSIRQWAILGALGLTRAPGKMR